MSDSGAGIHPGEGRGEGPAVAGAGAALVVVSMLLLAAAISPSGASAQETLSLAEPFAASDVHPFGRRHPEAPAELDDYGFMVGLFECALLDRGFVDGEWVVEREGTSHWRARWIMNGWAILDEYRDEWGSTNVNVRVWDSVQGHWTVHWATVSPENGEIFEARSVGERMVMDFQRTTPAGQAYTQRFSFGDIEVDRYRWTNEIVYSPDRSVEIGSLDCRRLRPG